MAVMAVMAVGCGSRRPPERREVDAELLRLVEEAAKEAPEAHKRGVLHDQTRGVDKDENQEEKEKHVYMYIYIYTYILIYVVKRPMTGDMKKEIRF